ncbi:hypothetical protein KAK06_17025 [Ideonella sp. 4Y11]|uniref:DUF1571 domain-containing protein n=1 Tax=Ideonella aquatica TaxID=2824119 RepID=A0A940YQH8_9BURK|nr:hypothetical protein [Ideonella aquatica]MBQ0960661.1 hypothetical protein [Ideonella aquatica]
MPLRHTVATLTLLSLLAWPTAQAQVPAAAEASAPASTEGKKDFSPSERLLLMSDQLKGLKAGTTLTYRYLHKGEGDDPFEDSARVRLAKRPDGSCCSASGDFLSGARKLQLPEVQKPVGNPVLLYFLERDIRQMNKITKGSVNYFRKRIRMALYEAGTVRDVQASYQGKPVAAREIILTPFVNDPNEARFPLYVQRSYRFVLSEAVPGQVLSLQTLTPGPRPDSTPLTDDQLTLAGASVPALQPFTPIAIRNAQ